MENIFVHVQGCSHRFPCFAPSPQGGLMERVIDSCSSDEICACPADGHSRGSEGSGAGQHHAVMCQGHEDARHSSCGPSKDNL